MNTDNPTQLNHMQQVPAVAAPAPAAAVNPDLKPQPLRVFRATPALHVTIPEDILRALEAYATNEMRTRSAMASILIREALIARAQLAAAAQAPVTPKKGTKKK